MMAQYGSTGGQARGRFLPRFARCAAGVLLAVAAATAAVEARADKFVFRTTTGQQTIEARLIGSSETTYVLERADGQYVRIPRDAAIQREPCDGPKPLDAEAVLAQLRGEFGAERFRGCVQEPYVVGLVLAAPLGRTDEGRATAFLHQVAAFMKNVDAAFGKFLRDARLPVQPPTHPLVVLVFEGVDEFRKYAAEATGGNGPSTRLIGGFYSPTTNYLTVRLDECRTYEVVLHEAIHQQTFNRNLLGRVAPIPAWFAEGLATGFEANQGKIHVGPGKISARYAQQALEAKQVDWGRLLVDDAVFGRDALLSDAYGMAWGLHWMAITKYKSEYGKYLRRLAEKGPLEKDSPEQRFADFLAAFGKPVAELGREFRPVLEDGLKRQKIVYDTPKLPVGLSQTTQNLGLVDMSAVRRINAATGQTRGVLEAQGSLSNLSPLRPMAFRVFVITDDGAYADWVVPRLDLGKSIALPLQIVDKPLAAARPIIVVRQPSAPPGGGGTFRVRIHSAPAESPVADQWRSGKAPPPGVEE